MKENEYNIGQNRESNINENTETRFSHTSKTSNNFKSKDSNLILENMRLEKENKKLRRENEAFQKEVTKLNDLIEQMKNIQDDELLMIEKISTKEIYGKAQKLKISEGITVFVIFQWTLSTPIPCN